jgi:hypothetical protein
VIYQNVSLAWLDAIESKAQSQLGITISGTEGIATKDGITISWVYDPTDHTLTVGDTKKPRYVPESAIETKLTALVEGCQPQGETNG